MGYNPVPYDFASHQAHFQFLDPKTIESAIVKMNAMFDEMKKKFEDAIEELKEGLELNDHSMAQLQQIYNAMTDYNKKFESHLMALIPELSHNTAEHNNLIKRRHSCRDKYMTLYYFHQELWDLIKESVSLTEEQRNILGKLNQKYREATNDCST
jgi:K+/H+ antiporter YhaU regulatory subunit KhtT